MSLIANNNLVSIFGNKDIYLDNDFLCRLQKDQDLTRDFCKLLTHSESLKIDSLVEFEFLRDVCNPKQLQLIKEFLSKSFFSFPNDDSNIFKKIKNNAVIISKIYKIKNCLPEDRKSKNGGPSISDFFLAARIMTNYNNSLLITGNKRHFPSYLFDVNYVINTENPENGIINHFFVISFNIEKFQDCFKKLNQINKNETNPLCPIRTNLPI